MAAVMLGVVGACCVIRPARLVQISASEEVSCRIDPNSADADTLCLLPSIGPGIAERIVHDRETHGPFRSAEDLARVPYVGEKTVAAVSPWVTLPSEAD